MGPREIFFGVVPLAVARSLRDEPEAWSCRPNGLDGEAYEMFHRSGLGLWVANRTYGMRVSMPGAKDWGGVTILSAFYLSPGHHLLRRAANTWLRANFPPTTQRSHHPILAALDA